MGKVAITGAAGFIGTHVAARLVSRGHEVVGIDDLSRGTWAARHRLAPEGRPVAEQTLDLTSATHEQLVELLRGVDVLIHLAAEKHNNSIDAPERVLAVNVTAAHRLFEAAGVAGVSRVIFSSSLYACGRTRGDDLREDEPPMPATVYGASKLAGEALLRAAAARHGFMSASLRFFFVYGPGQAQGTGYPSVIVRSMQRIRQSLAPVVNGDGEQILDYVHIDDVVRALLVVMEGHVPNNALINIGSGRGRRIRDVVSDVIAATNSSLSFVPGPADWTAGTRRVASTERARAQLDWQAHVPFEEGLAQMWAEIKETALP